MTLMQSQSAIRNWQNWLMVRNCSAATVAGYHWEVTRLAAHFPEKRPADYTLSDLLGYLAARRETCGDAARKRSANAIKSFFAFLAGHADPGDRLRENPAAGLPIPRPKKRMQRTLRWEQAFAVLSACDTSGAVGKRNLAMLALMLDSGIRAAEVCRLPLKSVQLDALLFKVIVKGGDEMYGAFSLDTANILAGWIAVRDYYAQPQVGTLFVGIGGNTPGRPLTTDGLRGIFRDVGKAANVILLRDGQPPLDGFSPHDLRRSFATLTTLMNAPTRLVQIWGRWKHLAMVEDYTRALRFPDFDRYSPVRNLLAGTARGTMAPDR